MAEETKIAWCDSTWNFAINCDRVSAGCVYCYIEQAPPLRSRGLKLGGPIIELSEGNWKKPFQWNRRPWVCEQCGLAQLPTVNLHSGDVVCVACETYNNFHRRRIFCQSLGDWLNPRIPVPVLARMLDTVRQCDQVDWLLCTKRPELFFDRMLEATNQKINQPLAEWYYEWECGRPPKNVWILATAENQECADRRISELLKIPAVVRGLSCEPLLGPIDLRLARTKFSTPLKATLDGTKNCLDWVIVGGESGKNARPCNIEWLRDLRDQTQRAGVAYFLKQAGSYCLNGFSKLPIPPPWPKGVTFDANGRVYLKHPKGGDIKELPQDLHLRQFPQTKR